MAVYGLLIDYEYCTGCGSCEVSCKKEHGYQVGKWGIRVLEDGPWEIEDGVFNWNKMPVPTDLCDLCEKRTGKGREPICVHHCLANVIRYDTVENLTAELQKKPKQALFVPQYKPRDAKGPFVPKEKAELKSTAPQVKVEANAEFEIAVHRNKNINFIEE